MVAFNVIQIVKQGLQFIGFQESNSREPHILRGTKLLPLYVLTTFILLYYNVLWYNNYYRQKAVGYCS